MLSQRFSVAPVSRQVSPLSQRESSLQQFDVLLLDEGIRCFPDLLAASKTRRFQVAKKLGVPDSHSSHTRYQRVKIRTNPLSQLSDDFSGLSLRHAMCVSVSKSTPPLDSRYEGANTAGTTPVVLLCPEEPPLSDNEEGPLLVLLLVFSSTDNLSSHGQVLSRFSHQFASPNDPSLSLPSYPCMR